jgi:hypothetical protein
MAIILADRDPSQVRLPHTADSRSWQLRNMRVCWVVSGERPGSGSVAKRTRPCPDVCGAPIEPWAGEGGATSGRGTSEGSRTRRSQCRAGSGGGRRECARTCTVPCGRSLRSSRCAPHVGYPARTGQANNATVPVIKGHMAVITIPRAATPCPGAVPPPIPGEIQQRTAQDPKEHTARAGRVA